MSIRYYDEAVSKKISDWVLDDKVKILGPNETARMFQIKADEENDLPLTLPLIAISRDSTIKIITPTRRPLTYMGKKVSEDSDASITLNGIPIELNYQIDIYTRYFAEADEYFRNFMFNLINYPKVDILIPYNDINIIHPSSIRVDTTAQDNSDIPERKIAGQFTRFTIKINIDDAYLFSAPEKKKYKVEYGGLGIVE